MVVAKADKAADKAKVNPLVTCLAAMTSSSIPAKAWAAVSAALLLPCRATAYATASPIRAATAWTFPADLNHNEPDRKEKSERKNHLTKDGL